jgi:hypothetical protein
MGWISLHNTFQDSETLRYEMVPGGRKGSNPIVTSLHGICVREGLCFEEKYLQSGM